MVRAKKKNWNPIDPSFDWKFDLVLEAKNTKIEEVHRLQRVRSGGIPASSDKWAELANKWPKMNGAHRGEMGPYLYGL